jgi:hypothetical protein
MVLAQLNCCCFGSSSVEAGVVVESRVARFDAVGGSLEAWSDGWGCAESDLDGVNVASGVVDAGVVVVGTESFTGRAYLGIMRPQESADSMNNVHMTPIPLFDIAFVPV